jgi:hypothetical protein
MDAAINIVRASRCVQRSAQVLSIIDLHATLLYETTDAFLYLNVSSSRGTLWGTRALGKQMVMSHISSMSFFSEKRLASVCRIPTSTVNA